MNALKEIHLFSEIDFFCPEKCNSDKNISVQISKSKKNVDHQESV